MVAGRTGRAADPIGDDAAHHLGARPAEDSQHLRVHIRQLRAKIGDDATDPRYIFTEPGIGCRFRDK